MLTVPGFSHAIQRGDRMRLSAILLRSFGPFNYDYRAPTGEDPPLATLSAREDALGEARPHVHVPIDSHMTALVGANESGKSKLLDALEQVRHPHDLRLSHVCRHSVEAEAGVTPAGYGHPSIGCVWSGSTDELNAIWQGAFPASSASAPREESEATEVAPADRQPAARPEGDAILLLRTRRQEHIGYRLYVMMADDIQCDEALEPEIVPSVLECLPRVVRVGTEQEFPLTTNIRALLRCGGSAQNNTDWVGANKVFEDDAAWRKYEPAGPDRLVHRLLTELCGYSDEDFVALLREDEQMKAKFAKEVTRQIGEALLLDALWHQDAELRLVADIQGDAVRFLVEDKTGERYGLPERSRGLKYFLAFLIRTLSALRGLDRPGMILFDEPDYALSVIGQRDMLDVFRKVASGEIGGQDHQVLYTTHSPYLIDRNHPSRVVGLYKGPYDEGSLVIWPTHRNLYEPVRTALGVPHTDTLFLDSPNLLVEGISDVEYVTGFARYLAGTGQRHLDLNSVELVAADKASNIPRILKGALLHPQARPYVSVLLDNDQPGATVRQQLSQDPDLSHLEDEGQVIDIHAVLEDRRGEEVTIEDLVPLRMYEEAFVRTHEHLWPGCRQYLQANLEATYSQARAVARTFDALVREAEGDAAQRIHDKTSVARDITRALLASELSTHPDFAQLEQNIVKLDGLVGHAVRVNRERMLYDNAVASIGRQVRDFLRLRPEPPLKETAKRSLDRLEGMAAGVGGRKSFVEEIQSITVDFELESAERSDVVLDYPAFRHRLRRLPGRLRFVAPQDQ